MAAASAKIIRKPEEVEFAPAYYSTLFENTDGARIGVNFLPNVCTDIKMEVSLRKISIFVFFLVAVGCSTVQSGKNGNWLGFTESGTASFYGDKHQNRKTANGELYKHNLKTAAHKKIPFGSNVKVTNINNGKSVVVRINDRGPFIKGRIIDLSKLAFSTIGNTSSGLINVKIEVIR